MRTISKEIRKEEKKELLEERMILGRKIKFARKAKGMTRVDMADSLGISLGRIFTIEQGVTNVPAFMLSRICKVLDASMDQMLNGEITDPHLFKEQKRSNLFLEERNKLHLTVAELAEVSGVNAAYIYRLESMGIQVIDERISTLCKQLGISGNELLAGTPKKEHTFKRENAVGGDA